MYIYLFFFLLNPVLCSLVRKKEAQRSRNRFFDLAETSKPGLGVRITGQGTNKLPLPDQCARVGVGRRKLEREKEKKNNPHTILGGVAPFLGFGGKGVG